MPKLIAARPAPLLDWAEREDIEALIRETPIAAGVDKATAREALRIVGDMLRRANPPGANLRALIRCVTGVELTSVVAEVEFDSLGKTTDVYSVYWPGTNRQSLRRRNGTPPVEWTPSGWRRARAGKEAVVSRGNKPATAKLVIQAGSIIDSVNAAA
jgi:hypothetical protein